MGYQLVLVKASTVSQTSPAPSEGPGEASPHPPAEALVPAAAVTLLDSSQVETMEMALGQQTVEPEQGQLPADIQGAGAPPQPQLERVDSPHALVEPSESLGGEGTTLSQTQPGYPVQVHSLGVGDACETCDETSPTPPPAGGQSRQVSDSPIFRPSSPSIMVVSPDPPTNPIPKETNQGTKRPGWEEEREEDGEGEYYVPVSEPPPVLSERAIYMRMSRVFKKRKDGTFLLDDRWNNAWTDTSGGGRDSLYAMFEKVGYKRDRVHDKCMCTLNSAIFTRQLFEHGVGAFTDLRYSQGS